MPIFAQKKHLLPIMSIISDITGFIINIVKLRSILIELAKRDFKKEYASSLLGVVWVYLQPLLFILVIYIVFSYGFRHKPATGDTPYAAWLITGMIPWLFFSTSVSTGSSTLNQYAFMVKKVDFRLSILPLVKLLSALVPHLVFVGITITIAAYNRIYPGIYTLQILYYLGAMSLFIVGINWLTSSTNIFVPDVSKLVSLLIQFGFWLTPIFWDKTQVPQQYHWILSLNPMTYIVDGYRDSLLNHVAFWEKPAETAYFWCICIITCLAGSSIFKRLRPHFAEVI